MVVFVVAVLEGIGLLGPSTGRERGKARVVQAYAPVCLAARSATVCDPVPACRQQAGRGRRRIFRNSLRGHDRGPARAARAALRHGRLGARGGALWRGVQGADKAGEQDDRGVRLRARPTLKPGFLYMCHGFLPFCCMAAGHGRAVCLCEWRRLHKGHCFRQRPPGRIAPFIALRFAILDSLPRPPAALLPLQPDMPPFSSFVCAVWSVVAGRATQASQGALAATQVALLMDFVGVADALACGVTAIGFALEKGARAHACRLARYLNKITRLLPCRCAPYSNSLSQVVVSC